MSATFNTELFANYFAKLSIKNVDKVKVYEGVEQKYADEEKELNEKLSKDWGRAEPGAWDNLVKKNENQDSDSDDN